MATNGSKEWHVVIGVDIQNCFMNNIFKRGEGDFLHGGDIGEAIKMAEEVATVCNGKDLVVMTKDYHPIRHESFNTVTRMVNGEQQTGAWPEHCRNIENKCGDGPDVVPVDAAVPTTDLPSASKTYAELNTGFDTDPNLNKPENETSKAKAKAMYDNIVVNLGTKIAGTDKIKGLDYSYFLYGVAGAHAFANAIYELNNVATANVIGRKSYDNTSADTTADKYKAPSGPADLVGTDVTEVKAGETSFICLRKGEYCGYESYSAFNYHQAGKIASPVPGMPGFFGDIPGRYDERYSTGLWEYLLKTIPDGKDTIVITVCGLVGNVCVINTVTEGIKMWNNVYSTLRTDKTINIKFNYSLLGTLFTPALPPNLTVVTDADKLNGGFAGMNNITVTTPTDGVIPADIVTSANIIYGNDNIIGTMTLNPPTMGGGHIGGKWCPCLFCKKRSARRTRKHNKRTQKRRNGRNGRKSTNRRGRKSRK